MGAKQPHGEEGQSGRVERPKSSLSPGASAPAYHPHTTL